MLALLPVETRITMAHACLRVTKPAVRAIVRTLSTTTPAACAATTATTRDDSQVEEPTRSIVR